jgi:MerR family transcriptional regulator, activator of bmr gene
MKKSLFTIGQISKIKGITIKALRFYERIGVIKPFYIDAATKYRYYSQEQFIQFDVIRALRSVEVSPKDIKSILEKLDTKQLLVYLDGQKKNVLNKITLLQKTIKTIDLAQNTIKYSISAISNPEIVIKEIAERCVITSKISELLDEEEILIQFSKFPMIIEENGLMDTYETGYVSIPDKNNEFHPAYIYNAVAADKNSKKALLSVIPAGRYICVCFTQPDAQKQSQKLYGYLGKNNLQPKLILQVNLLNDVFVSGNQYYEAQVLL